MARTVHFSRSGEPPIMPLGKHEQQREAAGDHTALDLDLSRGFLPEALSGLPTARFLEERDRRRLNQIRAGSYLYLFEVFETSLASAARDRALADVTARDVLEPLLRHDAFGHAELFGTFRAALVRAFDVTPRYLPRPDDLERALREAAPLSLLVLTLHFKLVTQQHYLACVRGDESLEPRFVRLLKDHWARECGGGLANCNSALALQQALGKASPGRIPAALRDYRSLVFTCDDVLRRQSELDVATLELWRRAPFLPPDRAAVVEVEVAAHRKTFLTVGIVNAAFVYAMRTLGPTAPAMLAGVVSALSSRS